MAGADQAIVVLIEQLAARQRVRLLGLGDRAVGQEALGGVQRGGHVRGHRGARGDVEARGDPLMRHHVPRVALGRSLEDLQPGLTAQLGALVDRPRRLLRLVLAARVVVLPVALRQRAALAVVRITRVAPRDRGHLADRQFHRSARVHALVRAVRRVTGDRRAHSEGRERDAERGEEAGEVVIASVHTRSTRTLYAFPMLDRYFFSSYTYYEHCQDT